MFAELNCRHTPMKRELISFIFIILALSATNHAQNLQSFPSTDLSAGHISWFNIVTFHSRDVYRIDASIGFDDSARLDSIASVVLKTADGKESPMTLVSSARMYLVNMTFAPPLTFGTISIIVTYLSNQRDTVQKLVNNIVEQLPSLEYPAGGDIVSEGQPTFRWTPVQDSGATIRYRVVITRKDDNIVIWQPYDLTSESVKYNYDGTALEPLTKNQAYSIDIFASDEKGNTSYAQSDFLVGEPYSDNGIRKIIANAYLSVELYSNYPAVSKYIDIGSGEILQGDIAHNMYSVEVYHQNQPLRTTIPVIDSVSVSADRIAFHLSAMIGSVQAVSFDLSFRLAERTLELVFNNVKETAGYKLTLVRPADLLTVRADQPGAKLVFPEQEGRLVDILTANEGYDEIYTENYGATRPIMAAMLYHQGLLGVLKYDHSDMNLWARIATNSTLGKFSSVGMDFHYRYAPTNFAQAGFIEAFDSTTSEMKTKISLLRDFDKSGTIDWMDGAKFVRNQFQSSPLDRFAKSFMVHLTGFSDGSHISKALETIKKMCNLTDRNDIWCNLLDFNDHRYPAWMALYGEPIDLDARFATEQEVNDYFGIAKDLYNTSFNLTDNYSDYYPQFPTYDPSLRVVREDGIFYPGYRFSWTTEAYNLTAYDYALKYGLARINKTIDHYTYHLKTQTHHIDAFHVLRRSYSLQYPSSFQKSRRGQQLLIDEFNKRGVALTGELFNERYVGAVGWTVDVPRNSVKGSLSANSQIIPLVQFIFHGKTLWGLGIDHFYSEYNGQDDKIKILSYLDPLILGCSSAAGTTYWATNTSRSSFYDHTSLEIDRFYFVDVPWMLTNKLCMDNYEEQGRYAKTTYNANTFIEANYEANTYTVQVNGKVISKDYTTIYPKDTNTFLIYSRDAKRIDVTIPAEWNGKILLQKLTGDGAEGSVPYQVNNQTVSFTALENTPYRLVRNDAGSLSLPEKIELVSPANNSIEQPTTFSWKSAMVTVEFYQLQVATDSLMAVIVFQDSSIAGTRAVFDRTKDFTRYYWRVRGTNVRGRGPWSDVFSLTSQKQYEASITLGTGSIGNGIAQGSNNPDAAYKTSFVGNSSCVYNDLSSTPASHYLYFRIDDDRVFSGNGKHCWITVEYYDTLAAGQMSLQYDGTGVSPQDMYKGSTMLTLSDTHTWKSYTFEIADAYFGNREAGGYADFRLYASGTMFARRVHVSSNDTYNLAAVIPIVQGPLEGSTNRPVRLQLKWSEVLRATFYHVQVATEPTFKSIRYQDSLVASNSMTVDLDINMQYYWRVKSKNLATKSEWSTVASFRTNAVTGVVDDGVPGTFFLGYNYPNPFNPTTTIRYGLPKATNVSLKIYNTLGQMVSTLVEERKEAGYHQVQWNANVPSGVYFYRLQAGEYVEIKRMILLK
jgi:hypothetical protein